MIGILFGFSLGINAQLFAMNSYKAIKAHGVIRRMHTFFAVMTGFNFVAMCLIAAYT